MLVYNFFFCARMSETRVTMTGLINSYQCLQKLLTCEGQFPRNSVIRQNKWKGVFKCKPETVISWKCYFTNNRSWHIPSMRCVITIINCSKDIVINVGVIKFPCPNTRYYRFYTLSRRIWYNLIRHDANKKNPHEKSKNRLYHGRIIYLNNLPRSPDPQLPYPKKNQWNR